LIGRCCGDTAAVTVLVSACCGAGMHGMASALPLVGASRIVSVANQQHLYPLDCKTLLRQQSHRPFCPMLATALPPTFMAIAACCCFARTRSRTLPRHPSSALSDGRDFCVCVCTSSKVKLSSRLGREAASLPGALCFACPLTRLSTRA